MSECVFGTCKHIADLEEEVRVCNEARIQAERDMFSALDRDEAIATLRRTLHKQDDNVQRLERELCETKDCLKEALTWFAPYFEKAKRWRRAAGLDTANACSPDSTYPTPEYREGERKQ